MSDLALRPGEVVIGRCQPSLTEFMHDALLMGLAIGGGVLCHIARPRATASQIEAARQAAIAERQTTGGANV